MGVKDINLNGTLIAVSEFVSCIIIINYCHEQKRLTIFRLVTISQILLCGLIYSIKCTDECKNERIFITVLVCFIRMFNSMGFFVFLVYSVEVFDTKTRMLGSSMAVSISILFMPIWIKLKN